MLIHIIRCKCKAKTLDLSWVIMKQCHRYPGETWKNSEIDKVHWEVMSHYPVSKVGTLRFTHAPAHMSHFHVLLPSGLTNVSPSDSVLAVYHSILLLFLPKQQLFGQKNRKLKPVQIQGGPMSHAIQIHCVSEELKTKQN
jgi:hypothetical protein